MFRNQPGRGHHHHEGRHHLTTWELMMPLVRPAFFVVMAFIVGVLGYRILAPDQSGWMDAVYMTVITLTTVGYSEIIDLSNNPAGRVFTTLLLFGGVGSFLYFFSHVTAFFIEGDMDHLLWRRRMNRAIKSMNGHVIVCGGGHTGLHILQELVATQRPFVLIESEVEIVADLEARLGQEFPVVIGDATEDSSLLEAGILEAAGVVSCLSNDKDNLIVTVSSRLLNKELRIVCRCIEEQVEDKLRKAGADAVVSPNRIGGLRMISEMVRPTAVSYLDLMLREKEGGLRVESTLVGSGSNLDGETISDICKRDLGDLLIMAVLEADGQWHFNPSASTSVKAGQSLVYVGGPRAREHLENLAGPGKG